MFHGNAKMLQTIRHGSNPSPLLPWNQCPTYSSNSLRRIKHLSFSTLVPHLGFFGSLRTFSNRSISLVLRYAASNSEPGISNNSDGNRERNKLVEVAKRLERTGKYFKRLGWFGFWGQLVCSVVSAVVLAFSIAITGTTTSPVTFYLTSGGVAAALLSVFWSFGYMRLADRLRGVADNPAKAPPRAQVVQNLKSGILINVLGMGAAVLGMQATVGSLVAKALTSSAMPYFQTSPNYSPVLALDVFLVQASANTLLSHFLGLVTSLELLRSVTLSRS